MRIVKILLNVVLLLAVCGFAWASPVDSVTESQVAARFYQLKTESSLPVSQPVKIYTHYAPSDNPSEAVPLFHVYNVGDGFVMVAADNRLQPVIAYSTEGPFVAERMSPAMMDVLDGYAAEIMDYLEQPSLDAAMADPMWRAILEMHPLSARNQVVVPPLIQTCWDQDEYYNILCPSDSEGQGNHVLTGCVATAMAQVMRYWEYPAQGTGSHSYSCDYGTLSADFGNSTYHYDMMPDRLSAGTPAAQVQEVAKLIYHCGVSVDMDYGPESSGSYLSLSPNALHTYFGYGMSSYIHKNQYSASSWNDIIKNQLDSLRPVLYRGQSDAGGHAFVCDGYDEQDYFHFNWGWNGSNNGYYLLSGLTPGNHNYNSSQVAVIGLFVDKPRLITSAKSQMLCSLNGAADTARIRVLTLNGGQQVTVSVTGDFTISDGSSPFTDTLVLSSGNQILYVRFQDTNAATATHFGTLSLAYDSLTATIGLRGEAIALVYEAPQNLSATSVSPYVHLTWGPPTYTPQTHTYGDNTHTSNYGSSSNYARTIMHRLCDTDMVALYPAQLTHISFFLKPAVTTCKLVVYQGGCYDGYSLTPGTQVLEQPLDISQLNSNAWNTVVLQTPVPVVLGKEIWYGVYIEAPGGSYTLPVGEAGNYKPGKGEISGRHYSSGAISWSLYNVGKNFSLLAHFQSLQPTLSHYRITRDSLGRGTTTQLFYDDTVTHTGEYTYHVAAVYEDGGTAEATTTLQVQVTVQEDTVVAQICEGDSYDFYGQTITQAGEYQAYHNDTMTVLQLSVVPLSYREEYAETCDTFSWNGQVYGVSGDYSEVYVNAMGCDSIVTLHLTVLPHPELLLSASSTQLHYPETAVLTASGADRYQWSTGDMAHQIVVCPTEPAFYSVTAFLNESSCASTDSIWIYTEGVGIAGYVRPVACYPNPAQDVLHVAGAACDRLLLYDMSGHLCATWEGRRDEWQVSVRQLTNGTYLLVGELDGRSRFVTRVTVQH